MKLSGETKTREVLTTMRHRLLTVTMETERLQSIRPQLQYTGQRHIRKAMREPVYRQDPVYATKYYYDIDKWVDTGNDYPSSGKDHKPYWNEGL